MKLLFFISSLANGGAERVLCVLSNELVRQGHEVFISVDIPQQSYDLDNRVKILPVAGYRKPIGGGFFWRIKQKLVNRIAFNRHVKQTIKAVCPEVIISFLGTKTDFILMHHGKIPIVASEHYTFNRKLGFSKLFRIRYKNKCYDHVTFLTRWDVALALRYYTHSSVMPNPLTYEPMDKDEFLAEFNNRRNILAAGRIDAWHVKGFDLLIRAFARMSQVLPAIQLDIAGAGSEKSLNYLKSLARQEGVEDRVRFLGFRSDMDRLMKTHRLFVLSSRTEGFGMVLTEAMANGCTCVSFDLPGPSEIIIDQTDGILVESGNIDKLAEGMVELLKDDDRRRLLALRGLDDIRRFSANRIAERWIELFHRLIGEFYVKTD